MGCVRDDEGGEAPCLMHHLDDAGHVRAASALQQPAIRIKRVYESPEPDDGYRVLVDRLWPRGLKKDAACLDAWLRDLAPSDALRRWFGHDPERWDEFARRYRAELAEPERRALLDDLAARARTGPLTLLYAARDDAHNDAVVLRDELQRIVR